ncbi:DNA mismatch repair protein Msh2p [Trichomonascus vanleenenianus]|uniref:mismatch repair ATPase MSH2 n=1 Tax=Trichomonascus vanleenenianus TaxID=2268995 RepID=UPI003ECA1ECC
MSSDPSQSITRFISGLPSKDRQTIRVFELQNDNSKSYRVYGDDDATYVAQAVHKTTSVIKYFKDTPWCAMNGSVFGTFVNDALSNRALKLEIYSNGRSGWQLTRTASPGNLADVEDIVIGAMSQNPVIMAVKLETKGGQRHVGACFVDINTRVMGLSQFEDNELFSNLESLAIQLSVKECIVVQGRIDSIDARKTDFDMAKVQDVLTRCNVAITERKGSEFSSDTVEQDIKRLLGVDESEIDTTLVNALTQKLALSCSAALISYLDLLSRASDGAKFRLVQHDLSQYMRLDASALKALNLLPDLRGGSKSMSLLGLLNKCKSAAGSRLLEQWLKQPLMDIGRIEERHHLVEGLIEGSDGPMLRQTLQDELLKVVPDINRLVRKLQKRAAKLEDVVRIYQLVIRLPDFVAALEMMQDDKYKEAFENNYASKLRELSGQFANYKNLVEYAVDLNAIDNHEFRVRPDVNDELRELRDTMNQLRGEMDDIYQETQDKLGMDHKKLKLEEQKVYGWCFRLTRNDAKCLKDHSGFQELSTQKGGVLFTSSALRAASKGYSQCSSDYDMKQSMMVSEVVATAAGYCPVLEELSTVLAHLDVIVSFAHVSAFSPTPYVRPKMHPRHTGNTVLKEARHPCMEAQDEVNFIPNDVELVRDESDFLIITGPNMGGKSTYIRQIGVIALMAQTGCFVPCDEAELTIFDSILARVGAGDSQLKGLSTFMSEMIETATILKTATRESLIIIDELGRGTSTYDGFGLAWAISEHIVTKIGCFALFATHFHELTSLAESYKNVCNLHVVAHVSGSGDSSSDIALLYKVERGIGDQSFGINVAEVVQFPAKVIAMAKRKASELEDYTECDEAVKKTKLEDMRTGSELLRGVLKTWASETDLTKQSAEEAIEKLRGMITINIKESPFVQSIIGSL